MCFDGGIDCIHIHPPCFTIRIVRQRYVDHFSGMFSMGQVVCVVLHQRGDDQIPFRAFFGQNPGHPVDAAGHAIPIKNDRVIVTRPDERAHDVMCAMVQVCHDARAEMQLRVGIGVVIERPMNDLVGDLELQVGRRAVEINPPGRSSVGQLVLRIKPVKLRAERFQIRFAFRSRSKGHQAGSMQ